MSVRPFDLPRTSLLRARVAPGDFLDSYAVPLADRAASPVELAQRLANLPGWANALLLLRNAVVKPLGLKTAADFPPPSPDPGIGDYVSFFRLETATDTEAILGENDKHLDFRISVFKTSGARPDVAVSTWVHPHNPLGRAYLLAVLPFHKLIVRRMLANLA